MTVTQLDKTEIRFLRKIRSELKLMRQEMREAGYQLWHEEYGKDDYYNPRTDQLKLRKEKLPVS